MKERIIEASIESLRQEGLRFSVDTLAAKLRVSKKTIYKYFPAKEELAVAIYEKYYDDAVEQAKNLIQTNNLSVCSDLLYLYFDSKVMTRNDIFNKYKLNDKLYAYTAGRNNELWETVSSYFGDKNSPENEEALRIIIDGAFDGLCNNHKEPDIVDIVIKKLVRLI